MDIPIACFNYGAQAEKVRKYYKGIVCNNVEEMCDYIEKSKIKEFENEGRDINISIPV